MSFRHKYNVSPKVDRTVDGITFASKKEAKRYKQLKVLEDEGKIRSLEIQPKFKITVKRKHICYYYADFKYKRGRRTIIEDVKGFKTDVYKLKKKLVEALYNIRITEIT